MAAPQPNPAPVHSTFMDPDMRRLWQSMGPLPCGFRLYGGTALALYLNHRESVDFDFFTTEPGIDWDAVAALPWLEGTELRGRGGSAGAAVAGDARDIRVSFLYSRRIVPPPMQPPRIAENGVAVASPLDLVRAKLETVCDRGVAKDYADLAAAFRAWPGTAHQAFDWVPNRTRHDLDVVLGNPPIDEEADISPKDLASLRRHAAYRRDTASPKDGLDLA